MTTNISKKIYAWLDNASLDWQKEQIITAEQRRQILSGYQPEIKRTLLNTILLMIAIVLIGGGTIMIIAHNWPQLGYLQRAIIAILPVVFTQLALLFTIYRYPCTHLANESIALLHGLSVGAAIALISQTYHLYGNEGDFFLFWILLLLPIVYFIRARSLFTLVLILIVALQIVTWIDNFSLTIWTSPMGISWVILGLTVILLPYLYFNPQPIPIWSWLMAFTAILVNIILENAISDNSIVYICLMAGSLYMLSYLLRKISTSTLAINAIAAMFVLPSKVVSCAILFTSMLIMSSLYYRYYSLAIFSGTMLTATGIYTVLWLGLIVKRKQWLLLSGSLAIATFPLFVILPYNINSYSLLSYYSIIIYLIVMSLLLINEAINQQRWFKMNVALMLIVYLLWNVFIQNTFDLVFRGIAFIITGILMVGLNFFILRRYKHAS